MIIDHEGQILVHSDGTITITNFAISEGTAAELEAVCKGRVLLAAERLTAVAAERAARRPPEPDQDPVKILIGLLAIPGVRDVAERHIFGSVVYAADRVIAQAKSAAPLATEGRTGRNEWRLDDKGELDDVVVEDVATFRLERMSHDHIWGAVYRRDGSRTAFHITGDRGACVALTYEHERYETHSPDGEQIARVVMGRGDQRASYEPGRLGDAASVNAPLITESGSEPDGSHQSKIGVATEGGARPAWQSIASAPRDGTPMLLWWPSESKRAVVGLWHLRERHKVTGHWYSDITDCDSTGQPTHWMPLPAAPPHEGETP